MAKIPTLIGRFQIRSRIGQGGMGSLYLAWDPMLEREIAIKLLRDDNDELRERFSREARSVARLRHPRIVMIFDVGEHDGQPFIAMEYIKGQTLADVIRAKPDLAVTRKVQLIEELCDGLGFAHRMGIVHRDIKPANIMVDEEGGLKILDFGIARVGPGMTQAGMLIGTLNYMSPEQVTGKPVDARSDIFAVGGVLYELLAYRQAFAGGLENGILHKIADVQPEPLETLCPGLDAELIQVAERALAKDPAARYQDLPAMARDLLRVRQRLESIPPMATMAVARGADAPTVRRREPDREALERRRASQIEACLAAAEHAIASGDHVTAVARCEEALLLDAENVRAADLLDRARTAIDERQAAEWLDEAQQHLDRSELTEAGELAQRAVDLQPASRRGRALLRAIEAAREEQARERERAERLQRARRLARDLLDDGRFEEAVAAADEALAIDAADSGALLARQRALKSLEAQRREALNRRARAAVAEARQLFESGRAADAVARLEGFEDPDHPDVKHGLEALRADIEAQRREEERLREEQRRAEEERRAEEQRRAEEARRVEEERQRRAEEERQRRAEEERQRRAEEERQRRAQEERERRARAAMADAERALDAGDFDRAVDTLQALRDADPDVPGLESRLADARAQKARAEHARRIAAQVHAHLEKAAASLAAGDLTAAARSVESALALDPDAGEARDLAGKIDAAVRAAEEAARREAEARQRREREERSIADAMRRARRAASHEAAIDALRDALAVRADHPPALKMLAERQAALERERAIAAALAEADGAPTTEAAVAALQRAVQIDPSHKEAARRLRARESELEAERAEARRARERETAIAAAIRQAEGERSHETALTVLRGALDIDPNHGDARRAYDARRAALEAEQAAERRRRDLETARRDVEAQLARGALDEAAAAIAGFERSPDGKEAMAPLRARLERERAAAARAADAARLTADAQRALDAGDFQSARAQVDRALQIDPGRVDARELRRAIDAAVALVEERRAKEQASADAGEVATTMFRPATDEAATVLLSPLPAPKPSPSATPQSAVAPSRPPATAQRGVAIYLAAAAAALALVALGYRALTSKPAPPPQTATATSSPPATAPSSPPAAAAPAPASQSPATESRPPTAAPPPVTTAPPAASTPSTSDAASAPAAGSSVESRVAELRALARQQLQAGAREQALGTATAGLKLTPDDRELRRVLDELATEARATTQRAREVASSAGAGTTSRTFQEGLSKERQAARLERQNQRAGSLKAYWEATDLFTKAGAQARAANTNAAGSTAPASPSTAAPAPAPSPPPTSATPVEPPQPEPQKPPVTPAPPAPQPAQPAVAPSNPAVQAPPPQPTPADRGPNDEAAIRATLRAYAQAFSALDVAAVQKVFPGVDARGLAQSFAQMRQQRVEIVVNQISVSGSTATVTSEVQSHFEPKAGRATDTTVNATFRLQKAGGGWIIAARR